MVLFVTDTPSPRLSYVLDVLFNHWYPVGFQLVTPSEAPAVWNGPVIVESVSQTRVSNALHLPRNARLREKGVSAWLPTFDFNPLNTPPSVPNAPVFDLLDLFFFHLTRYEEYSSFTPDSYGRFPAAVSNLHQTYGLEFPIVDHWADWLIQQIQRRYPRYSIQKPIYRFTPTFDLDLPWAYKNRSIPRQLLGLAKNCIVKPRLATEQLQVQLFGQNDPFDTFDSLLALHQEDQIVCFVLYAYRSRYDRGGRPHTKAFDELLCQLAAEGIKMGLHPSYRSNEDPVYLHQEKEGLEQALGQTISRSRQHYLKLSLPFTYQNLISAGIQEDWSMAYPDHLGFRAGTSRPFPWYDLASESITRLMVYPATIMDGTLRYYMQLSPQESIKRIKTLIQTVRTYGGHFIPIWHNSSFSIAHGWKKWVPVYHQLAEQAKTG